jgi:nucleoside-diphosphate-sugar epimerase
MISAVNDNLGLKTQINIEPQNDAEMQDTSAEIGKARAMLGWEPEVAPMDGLARTVGWHLRDADWLDQVSL